MPNPRNAKQSKPPGGKRRAQHEVEVIFDRVEYLMAYGMPVSKIKTTLMQEMRIPPRTVEEYAKRVRTVWVADAAEERATRRERQIRRIAEHRRDLEIEREKAGDYREKAAKDHAIAKDEDLIAKIEGNFEPEKVEIISRVGWEDLSPESIEKIIAGKGKLPPGLTIEQLYAHK